MIKLLIGGSPCTHWSIAQKDNRETEPSGIGWELFQNYIIAKNKFKPDVFLYENVASASPLIKEAISESLGVDLMRINSALVSAQNRDRIYGVNAKVEQPADRGILLRDILESGVVDREKSYALKTGQGNARDYIKKSCNQCAFEPVRIGSIESNAKTPEHDSKQYRVYSPDAKSTALCGQGGGVGAKTGLYAVPCGIACTDKSRTIYEVRNGMITLNGTLYPIKLADGYYIIRKLTVTECCRLQTLPDDYCRAVSPTQGYKGLGNGWTAEIIIHIMRAALAGVPRTERIQVLSMYDGIGTGLYCLKALGFENIEYHAYEIDKYAMAVAMSNHPEIIQHGDAFAVRNGINYETLRRQIKYA